MRTTQKEVTTSQEEMKSGHVEMIADMRVWRKEVKARRETSEACHKKAKSNPEDTKPNLEEMETTEVVFEERLNKMDTADLDDN
jgi:hypothetical protein